MKLARNGLFIVALATFISGCNDEGKNAVSDSKEDKSKILVGHADDESSLPDGVELHEARDPDAPARVRRAPVVIDDRDEISRTKEVFEQGITELYDRAMSLIAEGEWVYSEHELALKLRRDKAIADLHELVKNEELEPMSRTKAAEKLITLEDAAGEDFLFEVLQSKSVDLRLAALDSLREWGVQPDFSKQDRARRVLGLLGDPDPRVVEATAKLCTYRSIPGTEERLVALLESGELKNPTPVAEELADVASSTRAVDALLPHVLKDDSDEFSQVTGYTFRKLIEHPNPNVSAPVKRALYNYALRFEKQRYDQILVDDLAKASGQDAVPVLEDILKNASDTVSRTYAVEALARLQPERAVDLLVEHVRREGSRSDIVRLIREHAHETDFDRIANVLMESLQKSRRQIDSEIVRLFLIELSGRGEQFIKERMDDLDEDARMWATWKLSGLDLIAALSELHKAGVIQSSPDEVIAKMQESRKESGESEPVDTSDPDSLVAALAWEGIVTMFDAETGTIPCDHGRLIFDFAQASKGHFSPQWPVQFWHRTSDEDYDGPYTVQFVYKDRLYRTGAENYGDWYDVDAVVRLINFSLEATGQSQRFITLDSDGQTASFVFADPKAFIPIAEKYKLPLSEDASKAMRKGIEFERQVIEKLK